MGNWVVEACCGSVAGQTGYGREICELEWFIPVCSSLALIVDTDKEAVHRSEEERHEYDFHRGYHANYYVE